MRDRFDIPDREIALAPLDITEVGAMDPRVYGKVNLGPAAGQTQGAYAPSQAHGDIGDLLGLGAIPLRHGAQYMARPGNCHVD